MLTLVLFCLLAAMCLAGLIAVFSVKKKLKHERPEVFAKLYRSTLQAANDFGFAGFLLSGSYAECVSLPLKKKMDALRLFVFVYALVFAATIFAMTHP
jgi:hypothetical protein